MPLSVGTRVGAYEVVSAIGAGGMGEVYRARDHRLGRDVALKILPQAFAQDPDRLARFEREAKTLAALNHPNIAAIYGIEESAGLRALVMELVPGRTLDDVIRTAFDARRSKIDVNEPMSIARSIAEALEAAHDAGVIHRDLKPANVKVRDDGVVKVLDFGLAKSADAFGSGQAETATVTSPAMTEAGLILGTAAYMSPEQARGKPVDKRADVWAFGVVLYELLSGKRLFDGETISDVVAAVLTRPIDLAALASDTPPRVRELVARCLERDPKRRLRDIGEARIVLESPAGGPISRPIDSSMPGSVSAARSATDRPSEQPLTSTLFSWPAVVIVGLIVLGYLGWAQLNRRPVAGATSLASGAVHLALSVPGATLTNAWVSLDGRSLALAGRQGELPMSLWIKRLDRPQADPITVPGLTGNVVWSPDGRELAAETSRGIVAVRVDTGVVRSLTSESLGVTSWGSAGTILGGRTDGLRFLNASTGKLDDPGKIFAIHPEFLPDGRRFLFTGREKDSGNPDGVYLASIDAPTVRRKVLDGRAIVAYASGHLLFVRDGTLFAQPFDADRGELRGEAKAIVDGVHYFFPNGSATFDAAADTIVYATPDPDDAPVWVDRKGIEAAAIGSPGLYEMVRISPDGGRAVINQIDRRLGTGDLWLRDLTRHTLTRLTNDEFWEARVVWSPDGRSIAYASDREGPPDVYVLDVDRGGPARLVYRTQTVDYARAWLPGDRLLVTTSGLGARAVRLDGAVDQSHADLPRGLTSASPDGRWVTAVASSDGRNEISVQTFGRSGAAAVVSSGGGQNPVWASDSRSLYYHTDRSIFLVRNTAAPASGQFAPSPPELVLTMPREIRAFDVTPDGQRFIVLRRPPPDFLRMQVIVNWQAKMR